MALEAFMACTTSFWSLNGKVGEGYLYLQIHVDSP